MNDIIVEIIKDEVSKYNHSKDIKSTWREPVVGFADAKDEMFVKLKEIISCSHALPTDFIEDAKSVIVFFLPFEEDIIQSNIKGIESSKKWDIANIETNNLILNINIEINKQIKLEGYESSILPATHNYDKEELISDWSHRHVGYIAGIGTFGINNMLITKQGCCGRIGSIITNIKLKTTIRSEEENCLYKKNKSCMKCIKHCVADAILNDNDIIRFEKYRCNKQIYNDNTPQYDIGIVDACGKCMCNMPCSTRKP